MEVAGEDGRDEASRPIGTSPQICHRPAPWLHVRLQIRAIVYLYLAQGSPQANSEPGPLFGAQVKLLNNYLGFCEETSRETDVTWV